MRQFAHDCYDKIKYNRQSLFGLDSAGTCQDNEKVRITQMHFMFSLPFHNLTRA